MNQRNGTFKNMGLLSGVGAERRRQTRRQHGRRCRRLRQRRRRRPRHDALAGRRQQPLRQRRERRSSRIASAPSGLGPLSLAIHRLRARPGSTSTTTAGSTSWRSTARSRPSKTSRRPDPFPYDERKLLFRNLGMDGSRMSPRRRARSFELSEVSRGAAFGDIDNDGDMDVVVGNINGPVRLLVNNVGNQSHWLGLRLLVRARAADMVGARVEIVRRNSTDALAARTSRRQLRVRQRSAGARGPWRFDRARARSESHGPTDAWSECSDLPIDRYSTVKEAAKVSSVERRCQMQNAGRTAISHRAFCIMHLAFRRALWSDLPWRLFVPRPRDFFGAFSQQAAARQSLRRISPHRFVTPARASQCEPRLHDRYES